MVNASLRCHAPPRPGSLPGAKPRASWVSGLRTGRSLGRQRIISAWHSWAFWAPHRVRAAEGAPHEVRAAGRAPQGMRAAMRAPHEMRAATRAPHEMRAATRAPHEVRAARERRTGCRPP